MLIIPIFRNFTHISRWLTGENNFEWEENIYAFYFYFIITIHSLYRPQFFSTSSVLIEEDYYNEINGTQYKKTGQIFSHLVQTYEKKTSQLISHRWPSALSMSLAEVACIPKQKKILKMTEVCTDQKTSFSTITIPYSQKKQLKPDVYWHLCFFAFC